MRTHDIVAILGAVLPYVVAIPSIVSAFIAFMAYFEARRAKRLGEHNASAIRANTELTATIQKQTDGIQSALLGHAVGEARLQGREEVRQEEGLGASKRPLKVEIVQPADSPIPTLEVEADVQEVRKTEG